MVDTSDYTAGVGRAQAGARGAQSWAWVSLGEQGRCPGWARPAQKIDVGRVSRQRKYCESKWCGEEHVGSETSGNQ